MLCSNCSHEVRPVVAIDVDGTLGDYHGHFIEFAERYFDIELPRNYNGDEPFKEWFCAWAPAKDKEWHDAKLAYRQGGMKRTMPIFTGAQALCWSVKDAGAELWITTTRPYLALDNIVPDTVEWLRRHEIAYDGILFDEDKYEELAKRVDSERVVSVLDDLPEMYDAAARIFGSHVPTLIRGSYNYQVRRPVMAQIDGATDLALASIRRWNEQHV